MENPETHATLGTKHRRDNQELTIERHRQHWELDTEAELKNGYLEIQATLCTRHRRGNQEWTIQRHRQHWELNTEGAIKNGQSRDTDNIEH